MAEPFFKIPREVHRDKYGLMRQGSFLGLLHKFIGVMPIKDLCIRASLLKGDPPVQAHQWYKADNNATGICQTIAACL